MGARGVLPGAANLEDLAVGPDEHVDDEPVLLRALGDGQVGGEGQVAALEQDPAGAEGLDAAGGGLEVGDGADGVVRGPVAVLVGEDEVGLWHVGREDGGVREQVLDELLDGLVGEQRGARCRGHDLARRFGSQQKEWKAGFTLIERGRKRGTGSTTNLGILRLSTILASILMVSAFANMPVLPQNTGSARGTITISILGERGKLFTGLDDVDAHILETGLDLLLDKVGRDGVDVLDAEGVLGRQGRGGRHGVAAMSGEDLLVRLESAGTTRPSASRPGS